MECLKQSRALSSLKHLIDCQRSYLDSNRREELQLWCVWLRTTEEREKLRRVAEDRLKRYLDREKICCTSRR